MGKKFGGIELGGELGGYEILNIPCTSLPQEIASAICVVNSNPLLGATYNPIWLVGRQVVNGTNYLFIAEDIRATKNKDKSIVGLVINVPPGEGSFKGENAEVVRVIDSVELDSELRVAFEKLTESKEFTGISLKPVIYIGKQITRGGTYYIVCESKAIYPNAQPRAVIVGINLFNGEYSLDSILPIGSGDIENSTLFGYAFTW